MPDFDSIGVREAQKAEFRSYKRRLGVAVDADLTDTQVLAFLLEHAPDTDSATRADLGLGETEEEAEA